MYNITPITSCNTYQDILYTLIRFNLFKNTTMLAIILARQNQGFISEAESQSGIRAYLGALHTGHYKVRDTLLSALVLRTSAVWNSALVTAGL